MTETNDSAESAQFQQSDMRPLIAAVDAPLVAEIDELERRLAEESFRHSWDTTDERRIDGEWIHGLCCDCGEFVPFGEEVAHLAAAFGRILRPAGGAS